MRNYEIMYILRPELDQESIAAEIKAINAIFTDNGSKVLEVKEWGLRELAYEIDHTRKGFYVWMNVEANNESIDEFNRIVGYNEKVMRHIVVKAGE